MMNIDILFPGMIALVLWILIFLIYSRGPMSWCLPTCIFSLGMILTMIIPALYWQFRPWYAGFPPYFESISLIMVGFIILALPFFMELMVRRDFQEGQRTSVSCGKIYLGWAAWVFLGLVILAIIWRQDIIQQGGQARFQRSESTLFGSAELSFLLGNLKAYYSIFYFALVAFGGPGWRMVGMASWVFDGVFQIYTLHRFSMLLFILRSAGFSRMIGWKLKAKYWVFVSGAIAFVIVIIGGTHNVALERKPYESKSLTVDQTVEVISQSFTNFWSGTALVYDQIDGDERSVVMKAVDGTMLRLYDARSASAVISGVPNLIPYLYGETFLHILYSWIPRFFWSEKPDLGEIHELTVLVMPEDSGTNPVPMISEFYVNFGFLGFFIGALMVFVICRGVDYILVRRPLMNPWLFCVYPVVVQYFFAQNDSFSGRVSEGARCVLVFALLSVGYWISQGAYIKPTLPEQSIDENLQPVQKSI